MEGKSASSKKGYDMKTQTFKNKHLIQKLHEEKFTTLEEKAPDAMEVAAQAHEEGEAKAS